MPMAQTPNQDGLNAGSANTEVAPARSSALAKLDLWKQCERLALNKKTLAKNRVISANRTDEAYKSFDMLRTRLLQVLSEKKWGRVAITSPTAGCGKTFVATNLAFSMARLASCRTILMDMDLRNPGIADILGAEQTSDMQEFLEGDIAPEDFLMKVTDNLVVGLNDQPTDVAAEILQESMTEDVLIDMQDGFYPTAVLYDLPPALDNDDVIGFLPNVDGVLIVAGGGMTTATEIRKVEQMLGKHTPVLGMILNRAEAPIWGE